MSAREELFRRVAGAFVSEDRANKLIDDVVAEALPELAALRARVAELEGAAICPSVARLRGSKCVLPVRHRGDHQDESKRHYWSDDYAVPQQRGEAR